MSPRRGARGQAATWPPRAPAGYGPAFPWFAGRPRFGAAPFAYMRFWLAEEVAPGRLIPWLPVAFAIGILVYFAAQHEPIVVPASALALALVLAAIVARARPIAFPLGRRCPAGQPGRKCSIQGEIDRTGLGPKPN